MKPNTLNIGATAVAFAASAALSGCLMLLPGKTATDAEMAADVVATYPSPQPETETQPLGRDALVGEWKATVYNNSQAVIPRFRRIFASPMATTTQSYKLFGDGRYVFSSTAQDGTETMSNGEWAYEGGKLTIAEKKDDGQGHSMRMRVMWYRPDYIELRVDDLVAYENLFKEAQGVESVAASFDPDGSLRTTMNLVSQGNRSTMKMVQSPSRFTRVGNVE